MIVRNSVAGNGFHETIFPISFQMVKPVVVISHESVYENNVFAKYICHSYTVSTKTNVFVDTNLVNCHVIAIGY